MGRSSPKAVRTTATAAPSIARPLLLFPQPQQVRFTGHSLLNGIACRLPVTGTQLVLEHGLAENHKMKEKRAKVKKDRTTVRDGKRERETDGQTDGQTDRQTEKDRDSDRETETDRGTQETKNKKSEQESNHG